MNEDDFSADENERPGRGGKSRSRSRSRSISKSREGLENSEDRGPSDRGREGGSTAEDDDSGKSLYVAKLSYRTSTPELEKAFSQHGKVISCKVSRLPGPERQSRGFAFVEFDTSEESDKALKALDKSILDGREILVQKARRNKGYGKTPGEYMGPKAVSTKYGDRGPPRGYAGGDRYSGGDRYGHDNRFQGGGRFGGERNGSSGGGDRHGPSGDRHRGGGGPPERHGGWEGHHGGGGGGWAADRYSGGDRYGGSSTSRYDGRDDGVGYGDNRFGGERYGGADRYASTDRYAAGGDRYADRYGHPTERLAGPERYPPADPYHGGDRFSGVAADRYGGDRYGGSDRYADVEGHGAGGGGYGGDRYSGAAGADRFAQDPYPRGERGVDRYGVDRYGAEPDRFGNRVMGGDIRGPPPIRGGGRY